VSGRSSRSYPDERVRTFIESVRAALDELAVIQFDNARIDALEDAEELVHTAMFEALDRLNRAEPEREAQKLRRYISTVRAWAQALSDLPPEAREALDAVDRAELVSALESAITKLEGLARDLSAGRES